MKTKFLILLGILTGFTACNNEPSIQEYYVQNQEDNKFVAVDIPTSMFTNDENLEENQRQTLKTVKKINVLAYPIEEGRETYDDEKMKLGDILKNEKYQLLMKYGSGDRKAEIYFTGEEDAIDEIIVFGYDDARGMGLARVLGEDMNPQNLIELIKSLGSGDIDINGFKDIAQMFGGDKTEKSKNSKAPEEKLTE